VIYTIEEEPILKSPVMVSALAGWVDAGAAGTGAADHLAGEGQVVARFDPDALFDYRSQRPILDIVDGSMKRTVWPEVVLRHAVAGERDLLLLTGLEPDLAWNAFAAAVAELAVRFDIQQLVTFGSVPAAVPHTLPPPILTTAADPDLLSGDVRPPEGLLRVPAAAVSIVDQRVAKNGIPTVGFFAQVPHYVTGSYPPGVLALVRRFGTHLGLELPLSLLEEEARVHREQLDEVVAEQPEAQQHITTLESMQADQPVVSGEELASEIERYLRNSPPGDPGGSSPPEG
jgi:PAC2 family